jgi:hypothetical protein
MAIGIGSFAAPTQRAIRSQTNPLDKCTIISIMKKGYSTHKVTLEPGFFNVPAGSIEKPGILVVGSSSWWLNTDPERELAEIVTSSIEVARSVVEDYLSYLLGTGPNAKPGLFYVLGEHKQEEIIKKFKPELDKAAIEQKNWYQNLVLMGDMLWAQSHGNPLTISEDFRIAANELGIHKSWMESYNVVELVKCVMCGNLRNPEFPICSSCNHIIDQEKYKKLGITKV